MNVFYELYSNLTFWLVLGFTGQLMFSMRFLIQWISSERAKRSVIPTAFWYFSIAGGALLFAYALWREDPVFILGQGMGIAIYARNLYFVHKERRHKEHRARQTGAAEAEANTEVSSEAYR